MVEKSPSLKQSKREAKLKNLIEKNKVVSLYFDSKEIGMFHKIVQETGLKEQTIANFIRRNGKKSILKKRHLQIAKLLREQGYSFMKIAQILSDIEGFPIAENALLRVTEFNNPAMKFSNAVSISKENRTKTTKIRDGAIYLSKINNRGEIIEWGKIFINPLIPNEEGIILLVKNSVQTVSLEIKEKLIENIYNAGIGPKKIAKILSQILDGNILENSIWLCLQKLKNEKKITIQPVGFFNTSISKQKEVRIEGDKILIYKINREGLEIPLQIIRISDGFIEFIKKDEQDPIKSVVSREKTTHARRYNLIEIFIRYLWQIDPSISNLDEIEAKLQYFNIDIPKIQENIASQGNSGALKAVHLYLVKFLYEKGVRVSNIQGIVNTLSKIPFCNNLYRNTISRLAEENLIQYPNQKEKTCANIAGDFILFTSSKTGEVLESISIYDLSINAKKYFNILLLEQSARAKQGTMVIGLTILTKLSLRQICQLAKLRIRLTKAIVLYSVFMGDMDKFENRFRKIVDQNVINQIITLTKFTDYTIQEIAKRSKSAPNTVRRYSLKYVFLGNEDLFKIRFNPDIPTLEREQKVLNLIANNSRRMSIREISRISGLTVDVVKRILLDKVYHGNQEIFALNYPEVEKLDEKDIQIIKDLVLNTTKFATEIARIVGCSQGTVLRTALLLIFNGDYDRYHKRFPSIGIDDSTKARAIELILDTNAKLNLKEISAKIKAEGGSISPSTIAIIADEVFPDPTERANRFSWNPSDQTGTCTHIIFESILKRFFAQVNVKVYNEVTHPSPDIRWKNVRIDSIIALQPNFLQTILNSLGPDGWPLWEELGLDLNSLTDVEEIFLDFTSNLFDYNIQEKADKYAKDENGQPIKKRFLFIVGISQWFSDNRVRPIPQALQNARVINFEFFLDLFKFGKNHSLLLQEAVINNQNLDLETQIKLAQKHGCKYCNDTEEYWKTKGVQTPIFVQPKPQQTLDNYLNSKSDESSNQRCLDNIPRDVEKGKLESSNSQSKNHKKPHLDSRAICAALFPDRRRELLLRCLEEELAWEEYQRLVAITSDGTANTWSTLPNRGENPAEIPASMAPRNVALDKRRIIDSRSPERLGHQLKPQTREPHKETPRGDISKHSDHSIEDQRDGDPVPVPVPEDASVEYSRQDGDEVADPDTKTGDNDEEALTDDEHTDPKENSTPEPESPGDECEENLPSGAGKDHSKEEESGLVEEKPLTTGEVHELNSGTSKGEEIKNTINKKGEESPTISQENPENPPLETAEVEKQPAIEITGDGGTLVFEGGPSEPLVPECGKNKREGDSKGCEVKNRGSSNGESIAQDARKLNLVTQRTDATATPIPGDGRVQVTGDNLQSICNAAAYKEGALIVDQHGKGVFLSAADTKGIRDALDHVQASLKHAREDACGPDPDTQIKPDGSDATGDAKRGTPITGEDVKAIRDAGQYGGGVLIHGDKGGLFLNEKDIKAINNALDHVQSSLKNARDDTCGPDPDTRIKPDGSDATGDARNGMLVTGDDVKAIREAGQHGGGVLIYGDKGGLFLNETDVKEINQAVGHVRAELDKARPEDARQSVDGPVVDGQDLKNANPPEDPYPIHDPQVAEGQVKVKPDDMRDIRAAGRGEAAGDVVIATPEGRKIVPQEEAVGINNACDRLQGKLTGLDAKPNQGADKNGGDNQDPAPAIDRKDVPTCIIEGGQDLKNANPPEDPYPIHDPQAAEGQVKVKPNDLRDIKAAGRNEVAGDVVIATPDGRKVISHEDAVGINNACDRLQGKLTGLDAKPNEGAGKQGGGNQNPEPAIDRKDVPTCIVEGGQDLKNANPPEDPYPIHDPQAVEGQVKVKPDDMRDIRAAGCGEAVGDVVIATDRGRKVFPRELAERINNACDRLGSVLNKLEWKLANGDRGDHPSPQSRVDHPSHERDQEHAGESFQGDPAHTKTTTDACQQSAPPAPDKPAGPAQPDVGDHDQFTSDPSTPQNYPNDHEPHLTANPDKSREQEQPVARDHGKVLVGAAEGDLHGHFTRGDGAQPVEGKKITLEPFEWQTDPPHTPNDGGRKPPAPKPPTDKPVPNGDTPHRDEPKGEEAIPAGPDPGREDTPGEDQTPDNRGQDDSGDTPPEGKDDDPDSDGPDPDPVIPEYDPDEWVGWNPVSGHDPDPDSPEEDDEWSGWNPESGHEPGEEDPEGSDDSDQENPEEDDEGSDQGEDHAGDGEGENDGEKDHSDECTDRGERGSFL